jgi:folate-binding protein YgfZ
MQSERGSAALDRGEAFVDLSSWRWFGVTGKGAARWLHDLLTADIAGLEPGRSVRSLLLTATGRIRADVQVYRSDDGFGLLQDPAQPEPIGKALAPYVLSSPVELDETVADQAILAAPGTSFDTLALGGFEPSALGPGVDLIVPAAEAPKIKTSLRAAGRIEATADELEVWRIRRGVARLGLDLGADSLPAEVGLEHLIDTTKGCFLGQEAVARVRNLGRAPRLLTLASAAAEVRPGEPIAWRGGTVGTVTSAARMDDGSWRAIAMVRREAVAGPWSLADGRTLAPIATSG